MTLALCVVVAGNPFDGMTIFGPFNNGDEAEYWADDNVRDTDWWLVALTSPEES